MKLPIPSLFTKKEKKEYLLALLTREERVSAVIIEQTEANSLIIGSNESDLTKPFLELSSESLLTILDKTISVAEQKLPANIQSQKTIFGVPTMWTDENRIKKEYQTKLKEATNQLGLEPIGFIEIPQAILRLMQEQEGAPISAILVEIGKTHLTVSIVRAGKIIETKKTELQDKPIITLDALLKTFTEFDVLPSKIIVLNGGDDEHLTQSFVSHQWSRSLPFLHIPKISILPPGFDQKAVVFGTALQLGLSIKDTTGLMQAEIKTFDSQSSKEPVMPTSIETPQKEEINEEDSLAAFGFVKDEDIAEKKNEEPIEEVAEEKIHAVSDNFITTDFPTRTKADDTEEIRLPEEKKPALPKVGKTLPNLSEMIPQNFKKRKIFFIIPAILIALVGIFLVFSFFLNAKITIAVTPKSIDQVEEITFSTSGANDFSNNIIKAETVTTAISGSQTTEATGKKDTGTKAKGVITIFNSNESKKQLAAGTVIKSSNNLEFTTDKEATIASSSGDIFTGIKSGTTQVAVTAKQIGNESNLPSNTKFTIGDNQSLAGKNEQAFSGGSKKTVTVISQTDINKLKEKLPTSLEEKARQEIANKTSATDTLLTVVPDFKPSKKDFTAQAGDEAKSVTLNSSVTFSGIVFNNEDLLQFAKSLIKNKFDQDLTVFDKDIKNTIKNIKQKDENSTQATLTINAQLLPKIDAEQLRQELTGKSFTQVREALSKFPQVNNVEISLTPPIPFLNFLPRKAENITIIVSAND